MEDNEQDWVEKLVKKSLVYFKQRNFQKAKGILAKVLKIRTKEFGEDNVSVADTLFYIGMVLKEEGNFNEALAKLKSALEIQLKKLGESHIDTINTYEVIGRVFLRSGNSDKAQEMFRKVLDNRLESLPHSLFHLMDLSQDLVLAFRNEDNLSEAIKIQRLVLAKLLQFYGEDSSEVTRVYISIAMLLKDQSRLDDALQMLDKSIEICSRLQHQGGFDTMILAGALLNKAGCLEKQRNFEGAMEVYNRVLLIQKEALGEMHPSTAETYAYLADAYANQNMSEDAIKAYAKAINNRKANFGDGHPSTKKVSSSLRLLKREKKARSLYEQGLVMKAQEDLEKAIQFFHEALDIFKGVYDVHPNMAVIYENISAVKVEQSLLEDGIAASAQALKIRRRTLGDDNAYTKGRMEVHRSLLRRLLENRNHKQGN
ncbi:unnamed protein product [Cylindrotheca closterium]|uniref:Kinesin light chain n=1 Tax=Cylindrotheca closterium TaxID=2856 RepID=A0AAD2G4T7_9STRA|nr:unnamed protein product [Cylindrotheca closterium]